MRSVRAVMRCFSLGDHRVSGAGTSEDQRKNTDSSAAKMTRQSKMGTVLPTTCRMGETFLKTGASAGKNLFVCAAANVWTVQGIEMPDPSASANQVLTTDGTAFSWAALGGDVSGREPSQ